VLLIAAREYLHYTSRVATSLNWWLFSILPSVTILVVNSLCANHEKDVLKGGSGRQRVLRKPAIQHAQVSVCG
jgi:hypothetical protein